MLIYEGTKDNFLSSVEQDTIAVEIENNIYERMHRHTAKNEFRAWENSMEYMYKVLNDQDIGYTGALKAPVRCFGNHLSEKRKSLFQTDNKCGGAAILKNRTSRMGTPVGC